MHYLKIFSWLLFCFGIIGIGAVAFGAEPRIGGTTFPLGVLGLQVVVSGIILYGFKLQRTEKMSRKLLLNAGWSLIVLLIVVGQFWLNAG